MAANLSAPQVARGGKRLWYDGVNYASDAAVLRVNPDTGSLEILLVERRDGGGLCLPGGFRNKNEAPEVAAFREFSEETGVGREALLDAACGEPREVYAGYAEDPRNTPEAWIETSVWALRVDYAKSCAWKPQGQDDAQNAHWWPVEEALTRPLYGGHRRYIAEAVSSFEQEEPMLPLGAHRARVDDVRVLYAYGVRRLGVFGGSFDPVHEGHLVLAEHAMSTCGLDAVLFIPAAQNPLKESGPVAPAEARLTMLERAIERHPGWYVSSIETSKNHEGPSYTIETIREIGAAFDETADEPVELFLILGEDSLDSLPGWKDWKELGALTQIVVGARGEAHAPTLAARAASLDLEKTPIVVSSDGASYASSALRPLLHENILSAPGLLPAVAGYLAVHNTYA